MPNEELAPIPPTKVFICRLCRQSFDSTQRLAAHVQWHHPVGKRAKGRPGRPRKLPFTCDQCKQSFDSPQALGAHKRYTHGAGMRKTPAPRGSFKCPECGSVYSRPSGLGIHLRLTHGIVGSSPAARSAQKGRPGMTRCPECNKKFATSTLVGVHRYFVHGVPGSSSGSKADKQRREEERKQPSGPRSVNLNGNSAGATHEEAFDQRSFNFGHLCAQIQALITHHAERDQISEEILTARLVGFLAPQTLRKRAGGIR